jgi:hypothetical protein
MQSYESTDKEVVGIHVGQAVCFQAVTHGSSQFMSLERRKRNRIDLRRRHFLWRSVEI